MPSVFQFRFLVFRAFSVICKYKDFINIIMKNDFGFDAGDEENFDEFETEFSGEDFDEFDESSEDLSDVMTRTAVLSKNNMVALLCVKTATEGGAICRVDPRESRPSVQLYDDPGKALEWYQKSLSTSRQNGWQIVYDGLPLHG